MNQVYDYKRIMLLAGFKFSLHKKTLMLTVLGYFALLFIIGFFIAYANRNHPYNVHNFLPFHYIGMLIMVLLGGVVLASRAFQDMNTPEKAITQILVPASTFEKFLVPLISTSFIWVVFSIVSYHAFSLIFNCVWVCAFGYDFEVFNGLKVFNHSWVIEIALAFIFAHSIFLLGAAAFRKYPIVKTILSQWVIQWAYSLLAIVVIIILFGSMDNFGLLMNDLDRILEQKGWVDPEKIVMQLRYILRSAMLVLSVALYITAYFKLKEREV